MDQTVAKGATVTLIAVTTATPSFTVSANPSVSELIFELIVTAADVASPADTVTIRIRPFLIDDVGPQTYTVGTAIDDLVLPSALGQGNTYTLAPLPPGLSFDPGTRTLSSTPTAAGVFDMDYTVTDASGNSDTLSFTTTVIKTNDAPTVAERIAAQTLTLAGGAQSLDVSGAFSDPEGLFVSQSFSVAVGNSGPTGLPVISGTPTQGETLTADISGIEDADGLGTGGFSYQWNTENTRTAISGATLSTYTLTRAQVGLFITVTVGYTDGGNTPESLTSEPTRRSRTPMQGLPTSITRFFLKWHVPWPTRRWAR